jgi:tellurite resistance protein
MTAARARIPLNTLAVGLGLAGLAELWSTAGATLKLPDVVGQLFWVIATVAWLWLIIAHIVRGAQSADSFASQLRHPAQGPIAALIPVTGMLIAGDLRSVIYWLGVTLFLVSLAVAAIFAGWLIALWLQGGLALESVHGGYLLPTVAAGFVAATVAGDAGFDLLGWALLGVGVFFWIIMTLLVVIRLAFRPSLPDPLVPTMTILVAPPAIAGLAWFSLNGLHTSPGAAALAGMGVLLVLVQLALIPKYRRLKFSLGFWSFTFPTAAVITDAVLWVRLSAFPGWQVVTIVLLTAITALVVVIAVKSLILVFPRAVAAEAVLTSADNTDATAPTAS